MFNNKNLRYKIQEAQKQIHKGPFKKDVTAKMQF